MTSLTSQTESQPEWDMIIQPQRGLLDLRLGELWRYRDLVLLFVRRDFVSVYKQTILGPLWYLIQPLLTTITFTVIFGHIASLPTDGLPQFLFYMSGTVIWSYFADCLTKTSNTFVQNANLFGKVYFPRLAVPVSILISSLITFAIQLGLFLVFVLFFMLSGANVQPNLWLLALPLLVLMMAGLGLGFGIIISSLTTKYRDLRFLVHVRGAAADVRHAGHLPGLVHPGPLPAADPGQPDDLDRGGLPLRLPGRRPGQSLSFAVQLRLHAGGGHAGSRDLQPRRAHLHGYGIIIDLSACYFYDDQEYGMKLTVSLDRDEDGVWIAECPSIPGCVSQGATKDEALENVKEAIQLCLEVRAEQGLPLTIETRQIEVFA